MSEEQQFCPRCGRNYPQKESWCEKCNVRLVDSRTLDATKELFEQDSVTIHIAENPLQAELLRAILESNGILCTLVGEVPSSLFRFTVDGLAKVRIVVLSSIADEAKKIIQDALGSVQTAEIDPREEFDDENSDSE